MPDSAFTASDRHVWAGVSTEILAVTPGRHDVPAMNDFRLGLHLGTAVNANCRCDGHHRRHVQADGDLLFVPPGLPGTWEDDGACQFLRIRLAPEVMATAAQQLGLDPVRAQLPPRLHFRDPALEHVARALLALRSAAGDEKMVADTEPAAAALGNALALRLLQSADIGLPASRAEMRGLSARQRRMLEAYIEAHLDEALPLGNLARLLEISVSHFTAMFRVSYGLSPHQFVLRCRLDRADLLLRTSDLPISEVALATGFAHQSHLANLMRRHRATTPQQRRRQFGDR